MEIRTIRWTRSPRGLVLGVATGLAEWRGLPVSFTRLVVFLIMMSTAFFPALIVYLLIALILPEQSESDIIRERRYESARCYEREDDEMKRR
ncbi:MAG: PspC domain-containing protein, partial [Candidatus Ornithospirochaeta sp.]